MSDTGVRVIGQKSTKKPKFADIRFDGNISTIFINNQWIDIRTLNFPCSSCLYNKIQRDVYCDDRGSYSELSNITPSVNRIFYDVDTEKVYIGLGSEWSILFDRESCNRCNSMTG